MLFGLEEPELQAFADRIAATAIVNQAVVKCLVRGIRITPDNVILMIGDFVDPTRPGFAGVINAIMDAVDEVVTAPRLDMI
jgi:hypothetical protein